MRFRDGFRFLVLAVALSAFTPHRAAAQDTPLVNNVFFQSDLRQALEDIAAQTETDVIADPSVSGIVSVTLEDVTIQEALDLVLAGTGYRVSKQPDYYLVFDPDVDADVFTQLAETRLVRLENLTPGAAQSLLPPPLQRYVRVDDETGSLAITATEEL